jgi:hypothetical protein
VTIYFIASAPGKDDADPLGFQLIIFAEDDTDGDGIPDIVEELQGTDPEDDSDFLDTDGDGTPDFSDVNDDGDFLDDDIEDL